MNPQLGKKRLPAIAIAIALYVVPLSLLISACGQTRARGGAGVYEEGTQSSTKKKKKKTTTTPSDNSGNTGGDDGVPASVQQTCSVVQKAQNFTYACGNILGQYADELDTNCFRAVQPVFQLAYSQNCSSSGSSTLVNAYNTCRSNFNAFASYLPASCKNAIHAIVQ